MGPIYNHCLFSTAYKMPYFVLQGYVTVKCRYYLRVLVLLLAPTHMVYNSYLIPTPVVSAASCLH